MKRYRQVSPQVFVLSAEPLMVTPADLRWLRERCLETKQRVRLCIHQSLEDKLHEMFIALPRGEYVTPHKHNGKPESILVMEGKVELVLLDEMGREQAIQSLSREEAVFLRIPTKPFHTLRVTSDVFLFLETTTGPFDRADTIFPTWAREKGKEAHV